VTAPREIPVVSVVGRGDSGKTTFLEKLIAELSRLGVRVATVKHHVHDYDIDVPGKDSWRHAQAGAVATMVSSPEKFALIQQVAEERTLDDIARIAADTGADVLITEGYKIEGRNRIEVSRLERSDSLVCSPDELVAVVTDNAAHAECGVPVFDLNDGIAAVADFVIDRFVGGGDVAGGPPRVPQARSAEDCLSAGPPATDPNDTGGAPDGD
jgi:molybdopterin-guanine dinucleotide biosynthesis protein B